jgi:hypothetical protein
MQRSSVAHTLPGTVLIHLNGVGETAIAILDMLDRNPGKWMADLYLDLPTT